MAKKNRKRNAELKRLQNERRKGKVLKRREILNRQYGNKPATKQPEIVKPIYLNDIFPKYMPVEAIWLDSIAVEKVESRINFRKFNF